MPPHTKHFTRRAPERHPDVIAEPEHWSLLRSNTTNGYIQIHQRAQAVETGPIKPIPRQRMMARK